MERRDVNLTTKQTVLCRRTTDREGLFAGRVRLQCGVYDIRSGAMTGIKAG